MFIDIKQKKKLLIAHISQIDENWPHLSKDLLIVLTSKIFPSSISGYQVIGETPCILFVEDLLHKSKFTSDQYNKSEI